MSVEFEYDVFVSYSSRDRHRVQRVARHLRENGVAVWFDQWAIKPGDDIITSVDRGLESSRTLLLFLSPAAIESDWVTLERNSTLFRDPSNETRRFVPILLDSSPAILPDTLKRYQYIPASRLTKTVYQRILAACDCSRQAEPRQDAMPPREAEICDTPSPTFAALSNKKILIVDDDREIVATIQSVLAALTGGELLVARNGLEGMALAIKEEPDLILLDMMMPRASGFRVLEKLHEMTRRPKIIMMTANEGSRHKAYAELLGVDEYLRKPFAADVLCEIVVRLLSDDASMDLPPDEE